MNTPAGFIVSWKVPATVDLTALRTALTQAGLDALELAPDLKPASLVARTSGYIAKLTSTDDKKKLSRPVGHAARQLTCEEHATSAAGVDDLTYTKEAQVTLAQDGVTLECDEPSIAQMLPTTSAEVYATRTASDVTRIVQSVVESAGSDLIPVRAQGGAYFIPSGNKVIQQVADLLEAIGGELSTFACMIGHGSDASIANTITDYMLKQIGELRQSVDELNETGIRSDVKSRRLSRVAALRERIAAYTTLIQTQESRLTDALNVAEATLLAKLGPEPDPEPEPTAAAIAA